MCNWYLTGVDTCLSHVRVTGIAYRLAVELNDATNVGATVTAGVAAGWRQGGGRVCTPWHHCLAPASELNGPPPLESPATIETRANSGPLGPLLLFRDPLLPGFPP